MGIKIEIITGAADYIVPAIGQEQCIDKMIWPGAQNFKMAKWEQRGQTNTMKHSDNLRWVYKYGCGNFIATDDPQYHKVMLYDFIDRCEH